MFKIKERVYYSIGILITVIAASLLLGGDGSSFWIFGTGLIFLSLGIIQTIRRKRLQNKQ